MVGEKIVEDLEVDDKIRVKKIEKGIAIDHLPAGSALRVLSALGITEDFPGTVSVLMNATSSRFGLKDLIKLEGKELTKKELERAALIAPYSTVNVIRNFRVVEKYRVQVPDVIRGVVPCPNEKCVTNKEGPSEFVVEERNPLKVRCSYCERLYHYKELAGMQKLEGPLEKWTK